MPLTAWVDPHLILLRSERLKTFRLSNFNGRCVNFIIIVIINTIGVMEVVYVVVVMAVAIEVKVQFTPEQSTKTQR
jgi:hypothetical protein